MISNSLIEKCKYALQIESANFHDLQISPDIEKVIINYARLMTVKEIFSIWLSIYRDNLAKVNIFFTNPFYVKIEREVRISPVTMIGK